MSAFSDTFRREIASRAGQRCEYCRLPTRGQVATFPVDHIEPKSLGGTNDAENCALACPHCNAHKWKADSGIDPITGLRVALYHPRRERWDHHFEWSTSLTGHLMGKTDTGRATISVCRMNDEDMISLRRLLSDLGLDPMTSES